MVLLRARRHTAAPAGLLIDVIEVRSRGGGDVLLARATTVAQAFDAALNPVRASVEISAQVLSYNDLPVADPGHAMFLAHQVAKEVLAAAAGAADAVSVAGALALGR